MTRCERCVIPDTRPDTEFVDGVCSACIAYEARKEVDWDARKAELVRILESAPKNASGFDCIVPSSGGKDSTYQVLKLIEMGARPLVMTASTCMLTDIGRRNIANLARYATTVEVTPNRSVRAKLNRLGLQLVGDISWPEHAAIFGAPFRVAVETGIPLIFYGECPQREYGGPLATQEARQMTRRWVSEFGGFLGLRPSDMIGQDGITEADMRDYLPPSDHAICSVGVSAYFLGQFIGPWDSHENALVASAAGMAWSMPSRANYWSFENLDCAMTGLHDHAMYRKYGYGRGAAQVSVDIRAGRIPREAGLGWVRGCDGLFPEKYMGVRVDEVLSHIDMTREELMEILERFTNHDLFSGASEDRPMLREFS